jgi:hypothetical protein
VRLLGEEWLDSSSYDRQMEREMRPLHLHSRQRRSFDGKLLDDAVLVMFPAASRRSAAALCAADGAMIEGCGCTWDATRTM